MPAIVIRVITLATLVHLSQITPALSCTLREIPYPKVVAPSYYIGNKLEDCLRWCLEKPLCNLIYYGKSGCMSFEMASTMGTDWHRAITQPKERFFVVDRYFSNTSCPTVKEWIESDPYNH